MFKSITIIPELQMHCQINYLSSQRKEGGGPNWGHLGVLGGFWDTSCKHILRGNPHVSQPTVYAFAIFWVKSSTANPRPGEKHPAKNIKKLVFSVGSVCSFGPKPQIIVATSFSAKKCPQTSRIPLMTPVPGRPIPCFLQRIMRCLISALIDLQLPGIDVKAPSIHVNSPTTPVHKDSRKQLHHAIAALLASSVIVLFGQVQSYLARTWPVPMAMLQV